MLHQLYPPRGRRTPWILLQLALVCGVGSAVLAKEEAVPAEKAVLVETAGSAEKVVPAGKTVLAPPIFEDATAEVGLDFVHFNGMSGKYYFAEVVGSGGALFDYDGDGDLDLYLIQGKFLGPESKRNTALIPPRGPFPPRDRLYRNDLKITPDGKRQIQFVDVTEQSGIDAPGYGMGAATGDIDNDGDVDLYITHFGPDQLWLNRGDGTFVDGTEAAGLVGRHWSIAATFFDFDGDGWLDLYVGQYLDYALARNRSCIGETGLQDYCGPQTYEALSDRLYRNRGDGTFEDVSRSSGIAAETGATLGLLAADLNGDGRQDLYVANDQTPNLLWLNQGDGTFLNDALLLGCAVNQEGASEASMGVDAADIDFDGDLDLFMTHLTRESNTLYINDGSALFRDRSAQSGLGNPSWEYTGFGTSFIDYDNDGLLDIFIANGSVFVIFELLKQGDPYPLGQKNQLFRGVGGGEFQPVGARAGAALQAANVSRGALFGDLDNDGDSDVVISNSAGAARVLLNRLGSAGRWIGLRLLTGKPGRDALGARVALKREGAPTLWRRARTDGSFASANDPRVLVGLGDAPLTSVEVHWLDGTVETWRELETGVYHTLRQGTASPPPKP